MPPPLNFDQLRLGIGGGGGESKEALLSRAGAERAVRADARRRLHCALTIQRVWRGRRDAARARASWLAEWDARFGALRAPPSRLDAEARMLPPILLAGASLAGPSRLLRCVALALASVASEDPDVNLCATCASDPAWTHRARRLAALALDILETAPRDHRDGPADPHAGALAECALRLVVAMHTPASWRCRGEDHERDRDETTPRPSPMNETTPRPSPMDETTPRSSPMDETTPRPSPMDAAAATAALTDPSTPRGEAHHARLCAVAAELASRFDVAAAPLVDVAARAMQPELARAEEGAEGGEGAEGAHEKSAEVLARAPGFRAACACLLASPLTHAGLPRDALASFASPVAASACAAALRDVPGDTPEIFAIDTLLGTVTGWRAVQSAPGSAPGSASRLASAARARLATLANRAPFVDAVTTLALAARARPGPAASRRAAWDLCRAKGAVGCLEEAWFVLGVVGGPKRNEASSETSSSETSSSETPDDAAALFAVMRLYWALLDEDADADVDEKTRGGGGTTTSSATAFRARRRRLVGAVAFAPGALSRTWSLVSSEIPTNRSLTDASEGMDTRGAWTTPTLARGAADVPERLVGVLGAFAAAYAHLLAVVEDDEFFGGGTKGKERKRRRVVRRVVRRARRRGVHARRKQSRRRVRQHARRAHAPRETFERRWACFFFGPRWARRWSRIASIDARVRLSSPSASRARRTTRVRTPRALARPRVERTAHLPRARRRRARRAPRGFGPGF